MAFSSAPFLLMFLPLTMFFYYNPFVKKKRRYRNACLLAASLFFYAWGEPIFVFVMCAAIAANWYAGKKIADGRHKKAYLILMVVLDLGLLFLFKYLGFFLRTLAVFLPVPVVELELPIGISFFTFQILSYVLDVYYGNAPCQQNLFDLALYITMFPQLIAGPIIRYRTIAGELLDRQESREDFISGCRRFLIGLEKKILIADLLGQIADGIFAAAEMGDGSVLGAWIGAVTFMLELYYDFSGYSDMAIGLGRCMGFHFEENFRYPYTAKSITEFWHRWHISLSTWLRDYVYIPLGGSRVRTSRHILNLLLVWTLSGLWHGANWTFVVWGLFYGIALILERYIPVYKKFPAWLCHVYTLFFVLLNTAIFKASNIKYAFLFLADMFGHAPLYNNDALIYFKSSIILILTACIGAAPWYSCFKERKGAKTAADLAIGILFMVSLFSVIGGSYSPFIYFNF